MQNTENIVNPSKGIISAIYFAVRATVHTTLKDTPTQLLFGNDHVFDINYEANWKHIQDIKKNDLQE